MGRIKKAAGPKHELTVSPAIAEFVTKASTLPLSQLPAHIKSFPRRWPFPKGDLYHWIPLFNRFDSILEQFNSLYGLIDGPQIRHIGRELLFKGVAEESKAASIISATEEELDALGFGHDGDRELVEVVLDFSRRLLENCGNRSLYSSSERLGALLSTTCLSLLTTTLQLALRLAQRYHASRQRGANANQHLNNALLASHYNIDLVKVQRIANPFVKHSLSSVAPGTPATPSAKGKEKTQAVQAKASANVSSNDLLSLCSAPTPTANGSAIKSSKAQQKEEPGSDFDDWGSVQMTYYQPPFVPKEHQKPPATPTPSRRSSALTRPSRLSNSDESPEASVTPSNTRSVESMIGAMRHLEIPRSVVVTTSVEDVLKENLDPIEQAWKFELLTQLRVAYAMTQSLAARQQIVGIRLLAIANLAYIYPDLAFQQRILQQDSDEPRRLQITYQLADLVHPPGNGTARISSQLQAIALSTLEALAKQKTKATDVCAALSVNVNHGVLFYILRKAVAEMATEDSSQPDLESESEDRQEALFSLLEVLPGSAQRTGESLIAAGLLDILVEVLNLRTRRAERSHPKVLTFLSSCLYSSRDAMQSLANSKGLDAISDLFDYQVRTSLEHAANGEGLPEAFRTRTVDYQIPYFQQQSLRMLFKLVTHMMTNGNGNLDRLLRNLIDTPQLLGGLRTVITNAKTFGSSVWAGAINIMSTFIHNEPTSYAVISEAGLSKGLLEAIELRSGPQDPMKAYLLYLEANDVTSPEIHTGDARQLRNFLDATADSTDRLQKSIIRQEILPASDAILSVPQAFGAICLNPAGTKMLLETGALDSFFKTFESDDHIKSMAADKGDLPRLLGSSFDELVRHHPNLKMPIMIAILNMIERMKVSLQTSPGHGATLWVEGEGGILLASGNHNPSASPESDDDVIMSGASSPERRSSSKLSRPSKPCNALEPTNDEEQPTTDVAARFGVAMDFLAGFFENSSLCSFFIESGGAKFVVDTATAPSLQYDFNVQHAGQSLAKVIHIMVEQKPHLVLPLLINAAQNATNELKSLCDFSGDHGFFSEYISSSTPRSKDPGYQSLPEVSNGTQIVKSLLNIHTLCNILFEVFSGPIFNSGRSGHTPFSQMNLVDRYQSLIKSLGLIHRVCVWEEILLQKQLPDRWREVTKMKGLGMGSDEADEVFGFLGGNGDISRDRTISTPLTYTGGRNSSNEEVGTSPPRSPVRLAMARDEKTAQFKNVKTLRHLLSQVPSVIVLFSQNLGKALIPKRRPDTYARYNSYVMADAISGACLDQLHYEIPKRSTCVKDRYAYYIVVLTSISSLMIEGNSIDRPSPQVLTLLLQAFKNNEGLKAVGEVLEIFLQEVKSLRTDKTASDVSARMTSAFSGIRIILGFYAQIITPKAITDSTQSQAITSSERERGSTHYFSPPQFLVELRMAILPVVKSIWNSDFIEKAAGSAMKILIGILKNILEGSDEQGAFKRWDDVPTPKSTKSGRPYQINSERLRILMQEGYDTEYAKESLYRCQNNENFAREYCQLFKQASESNNPIPDYDQGSFSTETITGASQPSNPSTTIPDPDPEITAQNVAQSAASQLSLGDVTSDMVNSLLSQLADPDGSQGSGPSLATPNGEAALETDSMAMSIDDLPNAFQGELPASFANLQRRVQALNASANGQNPPTLDPGTSADQTYEDSAPQTTGKPPVTIDDLEEERTIIRKNLIDRALDVVNIHNDVTFELSDLITASASKAPDAKTMRSEIGETLVQSLISLKMDEDFRPAGKKIASYANLLALVLQDKEFYEATVGQVIECLESLLGFIKIFPEQIADEQPLWIGQVLLVIEKLLAEDVQPALIQWTVSNEGVTSAIAELQTPIVPKDAKIQLFEAIVEILPRIGKDESLALSVVRTLVILTRNRDIAVRLSEKRNIQRLFVMVKQLSGMTNDRLPSTFMLLLRHIVEDEDTIRQIMRSEIVGTFETRPGRLTDTTVYVKQMCGLVLRSPEIFVEVTNEKLELVRYEPGQRPQALQLKPVIKETEPEAKVNDLPTTAQEGMEMEKEEEESSRIENTKELKPSTSDEQGDATSKSKAAELKPPVVEHPSGIIHYLLQELLSYKDVEDKDPTINKEAPAVDPTEPPTDAELASVPPSNSAMLPGFAPVAPAETKKSEKPEFKPTEHPIYVYRCFILQCLAELLHCYNRTKIEFINFSRKADPKAMTPSKPRSGVLNYLLNDVIPVGTLGHEETIAYRKKNTTSNWAMSAIVSLCLRTNENGHPKKQGTIEEEHESELLFVRRFVLEHALKAYKDAMTTEEHADIKYARLLDLADLFNRLLHGRLVPSIGAPSQGTESGFQKSIAKLMFEKNFISALTCSIADVDLNFPGSKRAIKYILRPLKALTATAVILSQESDLSTTPGQITEDDEISTATTVSDAEGEREETPDLFRNSTLGMFEPGREEESSSADSDEDEEMYDDGYEDGMEFEDGMDRDEDEVISDEDEDLGEAGPMEGMPGDHGMNVEVVIDDEDDDDDEDDVSDDDDDDDDDDDSEDDLDDDDEEIEVIDEVTGDNENDSLNGGDEEGWQDEDGVDIDDYNQGEYDQDLSQGQGSGSAVRDIVREFGGSEAALQRLEGLDDTSPDIRMEIDGARYLDEVHHDEDEEDDDDDDDEGAEEDVDDGDVIYQPDFGDDDDFGVPGPSFGWDPDDEGMPFTRHHHHHHQRRILDPFPGGFSGNVSMDRGISSYRSHRPPNGPRPADDNANPLLQRNDRSVSSRSSRSLRSTGMTMIGGDIEDYWVHGMDPVRRAGGALPGESPLSFLNNLIASVDHGRGLGFSAIGGPNGAIHVSIPARPGDAISLPRELQVALGLPRNAHHEHIHTHHHEHRPATFQPALTIQRWREEALLLYGPAHQEKANRIIPFLLRLLVPPAMEKKKREEEESRRLREETEKRQKEEHEAKEKAERAEQEQREEEERLAAARRLMEEAEARARAEEEAQVETEPVEHRDAPEDDEIMEGMERTPAEQSSETVQSGEQQGTQESTAAAPSAAGPSEPTERIRTTIRGRELDITGLGIDLAYLDALPDDIREEVLMSQLAIQRSEAQAAGQEPTDISREFLEALPAEIREELLQQEAQDRRRRERDEARRRQQAAGGPITREPEDMDPASFLASLDPQLRRHVLMEQDEEMLAHLPEEIAAEARTLGGSSHRFPGIGRGGRGSAGLLRQLENSRGAPAPAADKPPRRQTVQMLDKAGVATLLRLMFMPQAGSSRQALNGILHDVSKNRINRAEVISLLLSILQDGSADVNAIERSFAHLSLRAKQQTLQKTPQPVKRSLTGSIVSAANSMEASPLMVIQQCLSALVSLTHYNLHVPSFFLTEFETTPGMKAKGNRKGKGKETRASKFALNALLSLLDRKLILESSGCMEQLSSLLQSVTHPLTMLLRKEKDKANEKPEAKVVEPPTTLPGCAAMLAGVAASDEPRIEAAEQAPASTSESPSMITGGGTNVEQDRPSSLDAPTGSQIEAEAKETTTTQEKEDEKRKARTLTPPVVPEENLRLVVNILAARECSAKTFRDTLSTINNLSGIPGAKDVFGRGLIEQAQDLGQAILRDLDELLPQIESAESGTDIQGVALAKFSPASSDQAKLLRVLTALDYLFDPKRNGGKTKNVWEDENQSPEGSKPKEDILTTLYENPTFGSLWIKLSECLSAVRQGEGMLNVATILLPLVEALMVVCKNTTLKDAPLIKVIKEFSVTSPPPESFMESLFFKFTEDHRKILNDLVRHNPKLMSGTFSLLVKNPKVLEFDNKRNYFTRRLHSRGAEARHPQPPLQLAVRRDLVFLDSFKFLSFKSGDEIKYGKLSIRFNGEEGVDAGGVTREWFQVLSRQMFNPDYALFIPVASDRTTFHPNKLSKINDEHLMFFKFIGRVIGKALYEGRALDCHFSRAVYKRILGKTVSIKDMETLDLEYYKSLLWMLENDITDIITETFSVETDDFGVTEVVDLIENGRNVPVTDENKQEYVQKVVEYRLTGSVQAQLEQFLKGFHDIVPPELIAIFNEQELELLISGLPDINVDDWKNHTEYHNYQAASPQIQWFWRAVRSFDKEERAKLLQFVTGTSKVPLNGFGQLEGMNGFSRFNIHRDYGNKDRLPSSHTCFNQLDLPEYDSYEQLRQQVYTAMTAGSEYFGFA